MIRASISPVWRWTTCAAARAPIGNGSLSPVSIRRSTGAGSDPGQPTGRTSGTPSSSLPSRSTTIASGGSGAALSDRLPLRITGLVRSMEENPRRRGLEAFRPDLAIYSGGALDRDRDFFAPGLVDVVAVARSRVPATFCNPSRLRRCRRGSAGFALLAFSLLLALGGEQRHRLV